MSEGRDAQIVAYYSRGYSMRECAAHFGLTLGRIQQILAARCPELIRPRYFRKGAAS